MTNSYNDARTLPEAKVREWLADFQAEAALYTQFPLCLINGKSVAGVHVVCSQCGERLSGDRVHGRVVESLPHVVTVSANGHCDRCSRLTHIDCRFRATPAETVIEWLATNGVWQAREMSRPTLADKIMSTMRRLRRFSAL